MVGMSGLVLQEKLNELGAKMPLIIITDRGDVPTAARAVKAGAMDVVQKPYGDQTLLDSIRKALEAETAARG